MQIIQGWLYIGNGSASFVSEERYFCTDTMPWTILSNESILSNFQKTFEIENQTQNTSYKKFYIEVPMQDLTRWFQMSTKQDIPEQYR
tara:strand:- start:904 stop:1167 length:264 start_codon:yes stop_codon:yes gene_type:complete